MKFFPMFYSPPLGLETKTSLLKPRTQPIMRLDSTGEEVKSVQEHNATKLRDRVPQSSVFRNLAKQHCMGKALYSHPKDLGISPYLRQNKTTFKRLNMGEHLSLYKPAPKYPKLSSTIVNTVKMPLVDLETDEMIEIMTKCHISSEKYSDKYSGTSPGPGIIRHSEIQVPCIEESKGQNEHSVVISCNSLFTPIPSVTTVAQVNDKYNEVCDTKTNSQNHCDESSSSLVVHISAECKGETKVCVNITNNDHLHNARSANFVKHNSQQCSGSSKKKRKSRPSCKKRRRLNLQKELKSPEDNPSKSNCAFSFVMGWGSPKKSDEIYKEQSSSLPNADKNSSKFSFFISGADLRDSSSSDDGFSESEDTFDNKCDEDVWNSFINSKDQFSPFNFQCVVQIGPDNSNNNDNQNDLKDPEVQRKLREANKNWEKFYQERIIFERESIVSFAPMDQLETVEHIEQYCSEYAEARLGPWEQIARDRQRFQKRIQEVESAIGYCFTTSHRDSIFKKLHTLSTDVFETCQRL